MAAAAPNPILTRLAQYQPLLVPVMLVFLLTVLVVPVPPMLMDLLLAANLALAAIVLLTVIFVQSPLEFSGFPSVLLFTTLFRLVLNFGTTRLILSMDAESPDQATAAAGKVIESFAQFVAGSSIVVGVILFVILIIVQFVVITKGATRISEVAARFTLDGMPGKQMAIDADLNAGLIDEQQAKERREVIAQENDFYGAMDGAAKFVRGDAIAGIIITVVNIMGGFAIGMLIKGWSFTESLEVFTILTIGDGLVSQIPAFVIALGAGLIVTRSSSRADLGTEIAGQLTNRAGALGVTSGFLAMLAITPMPTLPLLALAAMTGGMAYVNVRKDKAAAAGAGGAAGGAARAAGGESASGARPEPEAPEAALKLDTLELEIGYGLVKLVDTTQGGTLLDRISAMRRELAAEIGLVMPPVRIRDNMQARPNDYRVKIRGNAVASGTVLPDHLLAIDSGLSEEPLQGTRTREPAFGQLATWIEQGQAQRAEALNYIVVNATEVLATHLTEVVRSHSYELLTRQETSHLIEQLKERAPKLVEEVVTGDKALIRPGELQKVMQNLLNERVPVRDLETIVETLGDWATRTKDLEVLTEYVRNALRRTICGQYLVEEPAGDGLDPEAGLVKRLYCVSLDPQLEDQISGYIERSQEGTAMTMPPTVANRVTQAVMTELNRLVQSGRQPVVLASPQVRAQVRKLLEPHLPVVAVLGYNEIGKGIEVESLGLAQLEIEASPAAVGAEATV